MAKTPAQLERDIQGALGLPPAIVKKWKAKIAAYKRAVKEVEAGFSDAAGASDPGYRKMRSARDALDKALYEATGHVPYVAGSPAHLAPPIVAMQAERDELVRSTWEQAQERGRNALRKSRDAQIKEIDARIRETNRPYEWMKR